MEVQVGVENVDVGVVVGDPGGRGEDEEESGQGGGDAVEWEDGEDWVEVGDEGDGIRLQIFDNGVEIEMRERRMRQRGGGTSWECWSESEEESLI